MSIENFYLLVFYLHKYIYSYTTFWLTHPNWKWKERERETETRKNV